MINAEEAWNNLLKHEGELFYKVRGGSFTYKVCPDQKGFVVDCASFFLTKGNFIKAFDLLPVDAPSKLNNNGVMGSSYLFALLSDKRIVDSIDIVRETKVNIEPRTSTKLVNNKIKQLGTNNTIERATANVDKPALNVCGYDFSFLQMIEPQCNESGRVIEYSPQSGYDNKSNLQLHAYGSGSFCKFKIDAGEWPGVYLWILDDEIIYIGETDNLKRRFNTGYGTISARNCFEGGQTTNCKMNKVVLQYAKQNSFISLYFYKTNEYKKVELELLKSINTKYNVKDNK
ncbi:hypothetical protein SAMN02910384_02641 [Pseudobutyrivibrio sp. ACV-2]|uniref:GIY-YIG nuclease family protein n=1 Tax=Pseudobutyrivibrio sp. ACV-2 TaxID=1520801 RepID=UPI000896A9AA|nr:GIY-YIG nuclease family protein [Pseudobutyrivibrio sp. ACV-2]SEA88848.1 hypothetical protein SAMN02910384_02641 [Pseudobutyrivibrio sp. ACV-2]